ncbi:MAG TPA: hypothetical protein DCL15_20000 [Chloroflexi bacterium]|nr:hypothetical protein [Chloroflexota bacterium]
MMLLLFLVCCKCYKLTAQLQYKAGSARRRSSDPDSAHPLWRLWQRGAVLMPADIPVALVAFPAPYMHTLFETGHLGDIEALTEWLCAAARKALGA